MRNRIKEIMKKKGLKQYELAAQADVLDSSLSGCITGNSEPSISAAVRIARALGKSVEEVFPLADESGRKKPAKRRSVTPRKRGGTKRHTLGRLSR